MDFLYRHLTKSGVWAVFFLLAITGCKHQEKELATSYLGDNQEALSKPIEVSSVARAYLITEAQQHIAAWPNYTSLKVEIEKIENFTLQNLLDNTEILIQTLEEVKDSIPEKFDVTPVQSRLTVLEMQMKMLQQHVKIPQIDPQILQEDGREIFRSYQNLELQINEVFLKDYAQFDFDIDRQQDSILNSK